MIYVILRTILLFFPFILIFNFKDRLYGFSLIFSIVLSSHLLIGLITQKLDIFNHSTVLSLHVIIAITSLIIFLRKRQKLKIVFTPFVIIAFLIIFLQLWSVHNNYSGKVSIINKAIKVENAKFPYPYFSDEWSGVSLVKYSLENNTFPNGNPLAPGKHFYHFSNLLLPFFSVTAEIMLLLRLDPLTSYSLFSLSAGLIICLISYFLLRANHLSKLAAIFGILSIPLITNSSNLPGIWYYIPFIGGLIFFLNSLLAATLKKPFLYIINCLLAILIYPPLLIFVISSLLVFAFSYRKGIKTKLKILSGGFLAALTAGIIIIINQKVNLIDLWPLIKKSMFYSSLDNGIVNYSPENILPIIILIPALIGLLYLVKIKNWLLLIPTLTGLLFWIIYSHTLDYFIISPERVVVTSALLLTISAAFGFNYFLKKIPNKLFRLKKETWIIIFNFLLIIAFSLTITNYTNREKWNKLKLQANINGKIIEVSPLPPATNYLTKDDLIIFKPLVKEKFLSQNWKGLVIGASTGNYPMDSKPSFIGNHFLSYNDFLKADCYLKNNLAKNHGFDYVYSPRFSCPFFQEISINDSENLRLYKFNPS